MAITIPQIEARPTKFDIVSCGISGSILPLPKQSKDSKVARNILWIAVLFLARFDSFNCIALDFT